MYKIIKFDMKYIKEFTSLFNQWDVPMKFSETEIKQAIEDTIIKGKNEVSIVLDEKNNLVAYASYGSCFHIGFKPYVEIHQIIVDKSIRSKGVGKILLEYIEEKAKKEEIYIVKLCSQNHRERSHKFYRKNGFKVFKESLFFEKILVK